MDDIQKKLEEEEEFIVLRRKEKSIYGVILFDDPNEPIIISFYTILNLVTWLPLHTQTLYSNHEYGHYLVDDDDDDDPHSRYGAYIVHAFYLEIE